MSYPLSTTLLTPETSILLLVDYQAHVMSDIGSHDHELIEFNGRALARMAVAFCIPVALSTIGVKTRGDHPTLASIKSELTDSPEYDRTTMNAWEDEAFVRAIKNTGRRRLVFAGLTSEVCLQMPVLHAQRDGWETYFVADAIGGVSMTTHDMALQRLVQAGSQPLTLIALFAEWIRDWSGNPLDKKAIEFMAWYMAESKKIRDRLRDHPYNAALV